MAAGKEESVVGHGEPQKAVTEFDAPKKKGRNKFSIACTILASMTSILLGYGEFRTGCLFSGKIEDNFLSDWYLFF